MSSYIIEHKTTYYDVLQRVRTHNDWESIILYFLQGIEYTARETIDIINRIKDVMQIHKTSMREKMPKLYSQDFLNTLFKQPYTTIRLLAQDLNVAYLTARKYLETIVTIGLVEKVKIGKHSYYVNSDLFEILSWKKT